MIMSDKQLLNIPPPLRKPTEYECCGRGCRPCIFDYYRKALQQWEEKYLKDGNPVVSVDTKKKSF